MNGLKLDASGVGTHLRLQGSDGATFELPLVDVESQQVGQQSIMPTGLEKTMTTAELRDLLAFLSATSGE